MTQHGSETKKKRYKAPQLVSSEPQKEQSVLLICTGQYNCIDDGVGYDCCQPSPDECGSC